MPISEVEIMIDCDNCGGKGKCPISAISIGKGEKIADISDEEFERRKYIDFWLPCGKCDGTGKITIKPNSN